MAFAIASRMSSLSSGMSFGCVKLTNSSYPLKHCYNYKIISSLSAKSSGFNFHRCLQSSSDGNKQIEKPKGIQGLKQAVRDYGATIIVFHVTLSLTCLGICYLAISSGVDAVSLLQKVGLPDSIVSNKIAVGGSTFLVSYAVYKVFAPARIAITLSAAPFIVRYLRRINVLKPPKQKI